MKNNLKVGDRVKVVVSKTDLPEGWGINLTGKLVFIDTDGTVAVEVDNGNARGHNLTWSNHPISSHNGWWFEVDEVKPLVQKEQRR